MIQLKAFLIITFFTLSFSVCYTSFDIKHSKEDCSFHYSASDQTCSNYTFTHCEYYQNTTVDWLGIFRDKIIPEFYSEPNLYKCSLVCCKGNLSLPLGMQAQKTCQEYKFTHEIIQFSFLDYVFQLIYLGFALLLLFLLLLGIYECVMRAFEQLRNRPRREIEMQLL